MSGSAKIYIPLANGRGIVKRISLLVLTLVASAANELAVRIEAGEKRYHTEATSTAAGLRK